MLRVPSDKSRAPEPEGRNPINLRPRTDSKNNREGLMSAVRIAIWRKMLKAFESGWETDEGKVLQP